METSLEYIRFRLAIRVLQQAGYYLVNPQMAVKFQLWRTPAKNIPVHPMLSEWKQNQENDARV